MSGARFARRLLALLATVLLVHAAAFLLVRGTRGGPFDGERELHPEVRAALDARFGLDRPLAEQYVAALGGLLRGDFGPSLRYRDTPVRRILADAAPLSLLLGGGALALALALGAPLGLWAARRGGWRETAALGAGTLLLAVPAFVLAGVLVLVFGFALGWLPPAGSGGPLSLVLPWVSLGLPLAAQVMRLVHGAACEILSGPAVRAARARGLGEREILRRHVLRGALVPAAAFLGPAAAAVLTGSLVVEQVFGLPGLGAHFVQAALHRDYTLALGATVLYAVVLGFCTLLADLLIARLDPRAEALS